MKTLKQTQREAISNDVAAFLAKGNKISTERVMTEQERIDAINANGSISRNQKIYAINKLKGAVSKGAE